MSRVWIGSRRAGAHLANLLALYGGGSTSDLDPGGVSREGTLREHQRGHERPAAVTRTPWTFGPCWRVQKALDDQGIAYEVVAGPWRPKNRTAVIDGTSQAVHPAIQFEDGTWYRDESKEMARTINAGRLMEK